VLNRAIENNPDERGDPFDIRTLENMGGNLPPPHHLGGEVQRCGIKNNDPLVWLAHVALENLERQIFPGRIVEKDSPAVAIVSLDDVAGILHAVYVQRDL
jgi:hypothetical protein